MLANKPRDSKLLEKLNQLLSRELKHEALTSTLAANPEWTLHTSEVPQNMVLNHR